MTRRGQEARAVAHCHIAAIPGAAERIGDDLHAVITRHHAGSAILYCVVDSVVRVDHLSLR